MSRSVPSRSQPYLRSTLPPPTGNLATRDIRTKDHPQRAATGAALGYRAERSVALFAHFASRVWSNYLRQRGPRWGGDAPPPCPLFAAHFHSRLPIDGRPGHALGANSLGS